MKASFPRDQTARKRPARVFHDDRPCAKWRAVARRLPRAISFAGRTSKQSGARRKRRSMPARTRRFCRARKKHESFVSHSRVPGADKAQARHEPLISSLERGRRNCDVLAKRSNLRFFWFSSDSNAGDSRPIAWRARRGIPKTRQSATRQARHPPDAPRLERTHPKFGPYRTFYPQLVHFIVYGPDGGCDIVTPAAVLTARGVRACRPVRGCRGPVSARSRRAPTSRRPRVASTVRARSPSANAETRLSVLTGDAMETAMVTPTGSLPHVRVVGFEPVPSMSARRRTRAAPSSRVFWAARPSP